MVCESCRFCSGERPSRAFRLSRSIPEQKALPAPVRMTTRASDFATSSSAPSRSSINSKLIALRLSGRFSVMVATRASYASCMVWYGIASLQLPNFKLLGTVAIIGMIRLRRNLAPRTSCFAQHDKLNLPRATPNTLPRPLLSLLTAYLAASVPVILLPVLSASRSLSPSKYCRPARLARRDIRQVLPARNRNGGSRHRTPQESFLPPVPDDCAGARRFRGNHT